MDRRTTTALFLMMAVIYIWMGMAPPRPMPVVEPVATTEMRSSHMASNGSGSLAIPMEEERIVEPVERRRVRIETDDLRLVFDALGASIEKAEVLDHVYNSGHRREGEPITLFDAGEKGGGGTYSIDRVGGSVDLAAVVFNYDGLEEIRAREDQTVEIKFYAELSDGTEVTRIYEVAGSGHLLMSRLDFKGEARVASYEFNWDVPLLSTESTQKIDEESFRGLVFEEARLEDIQLKEVDKGEEKRFSGRIGWAGARTRYFLVALLPQVLDHLSAQVSGARGAYEPEGFGVKLRRERVHRGDFRDTQGIVIGPIDYDELQALDRGVDRVVDFGGSFLRPISKVIFWAMEKIHEYVPSYGLVILILSLLVKALFWPLTHKSYESMRAMRDLSPKIKALQAKHEGNPQKLQQETMAMYRENGVNPLGGCLPMLAQMPVLYALFIVFRSTIAFRGQGFLGYLPDLAAPDPLYILPAFMGLTMLLQQMLNKVEDPKQRTIGLVMPVVFTFVFLKMPSGLVLYWTTSNIISMIQQALVNRRPA